MDITVNLGTASSPRHVGRGHPCYVIAEAGINHNGDVGIAKRLIEAAASAGCEAVKLQKRTVDAVYSEVQLAAPREHPLGGAQTYRRQKEALELDRAAWETLAMHARERGLVLTASAWDPQAVRDVVEWVDPPWLKVASATLANRDKATLDAYGETGLPLVVSTGGCGDEEVGWFLDRYASAEVVLLHCCSLYPAPDATLNLRSIEWLEDHWSVAVGYSGHEVGIATSVTAVALGACVVERHVTLDRAMYGSDQAASLEPHGLARLVRDIRASEAAMGEYAKSPVEGESVVLRKLRRAGL